MGAANPKIRQKMVNTMKQKYGDIYQKLPEYKQKTRKTNLERYGVEQYLSSKEARKQIQQTQRQKYNGLLYVQTDQFKQLASKNYYQKNLNQLQAKGQRDNYYKKIKQLLEDQGYELLFSIDQYRAKRDGLKNQWIKYPFKCKKCGYQFKSPLNNINSQGINCPKCCKHSKSMIQHNLFEGIKKLYPNYTFIEDQNRILDKHQQIDIYCEQLKFGIEYNGNCWHAQKFNHKMKDYHFNKFLNFKRNNVNVLSFYSDQFLTHSKQIYQIIDILMTNNKYQINDVKLQFKDNLNNEQQNLLKHKCFSNISSNQKFIFISDLNNQLLVILKYYLDKNQLFINQIIHIQRTDFKRLISLTIQKLNRKIYFKLDNRLLPYYNLFLTQNLKFIKYTQPQFYKLRKGRSKRLFNNQNLINFDDEDIIWNYAESIFQN